MKLRSKIFKSVALFLAINMLFQLLNPTIVFALTGGPSQPEVQSFEPVSTSEMVDPFSGDFSYNIPLLDVEGYPINISYHSGITMDQEASWVGLGWNINPGVINRSMRGIPDDFSGDLIKKEMNIRNNNTYGVTGSFGAEVFGFEALILRYGIGINYNNYAGVGFEQSFNAAYSAGAKSEGQLTSSLGIKSSGDGLTLSPELSFDHKLDNVSKGDRFVGGNIGCSFNSRSGLKALSLGVYRQTGGIATTGKKAGTYQRSGAGSGGSNISIGMQTYVPQVNMPMRTMAASFSLKGGLTFFGLEGTGNLSGYFSSQSLAQKSDQIPAYGYLNMDQGQKMSKVLLDFNREKDGAFTPNTPDLPLTNFTYDIYAVSGQGIGGMYRPFRNDLGYVFDNRVGSISDSYSLGIELSSGNLVKGGSDFTITDVYTTSGQWVEDNDAAPLLKFTAPPTTASTYENYYFKEAGEKNLDSDPALYDNIKGDVAVRIGLENRGGLTVGSKTTFIDEAGTESNMPAVNYRNGGKRQKRNQNISFLSLGEAKNAGVQTSIYTLNPALNTTQYNHHIAEVSVLRTDGSRYVYGWPAYNWTQEETTFNVGTATGDCSNGLVSYNPGVDNSTSNKQGLDNYYSNTTLPAYAHSYLLTAVLSPDYVDVDGVPGPTEGDLGTYTKFTYVKPNVANYKWRVPFLANTANFNEGLKSDHGDNQGNYLYGEKDLQYLDVAETKNYKVIFTREDREDGRGVTDKNGGMGAGKSQLLRKISLYSKKDLTKPIKEVNFEYDYSLCPLVDNNTGQSVLVNGVNINTNKGKLTLKKIYFTYGTSKKARLSPYTFSYGSFNPGYNLKGYDRWGNYKPNNGACLTEGGTGMNNAEYPYTDQDKINTDQYAAAWSLQTVNLPSGGTINVSYESDDYAYVQDRKAMQMFKISSVESVSTASGSSNNNLLMQLGLVTPAPNNFIYFKLQSPITATSDPNADIALFKAQYINGVDNLYFRALVKMTTAATSYEYVSGYTKILSSGLASAVSGQYLYGYIKLWDTTDKKAGLTVNVNPISKAAWQFGRLHTPRLVYDQPNISEDSGVEQVIKALANSSFAKNIANLILGPNGTLEAQDFGKQIVPEKSFIRLLSPSAHKLGGGARVKQITTGDSWDLMASAAAYSYGQTYLYETTDPSTNNIISSGVASYEPMVGNDENPFHKPVPFTNAQDEKYLIPDDEHYLEEPFGESFFPAPSIGYSKVTIKNLPRYVNDNPTQPIKVSRHATGAVVYEFYTAKDFPIFPHNTGLDAREKKVNPFFQLFQVYNADFMTASQGYVVELNDMHGKPKRQSVYAENQVDPISKVEYIYKANGNKLNNSVTVIDGFGVASTKNVGIDYDFIADMREQTSSTSNAGLNGNLTSFLAVIFPAVVPTILPSYSGEDTRFRSAVVTKVINRYGILESTTAQDLGSKVTTTNTAFDAETGEVLATKTQNEFDDPVYSFSYPAHWGYDNMGPAYRNTGLTIPSTSFANGVATIANASTYFVPGDELLIGGTELAWVTNVQSGSITANMANGTGYTGTGAVKVIRSGRRNKQSVVIGSVSTTTDPVPGLVNNNISGVLNASATEYDEFWKTYCECLANNGNPNLTTNPYRLGLKGNPRVKKSYLYLCERTQAVKNYNTSIRTDGQYKTFSPFWKAPVGGALLWSGNVTGWTYTSETTQYDPNGFEIETKDALNRYSSALYGYNHTLATAVSSNAQFKEIAFDNFEDYAFGTCEYFHFSYKASAANIISTESHTGTKSIKVPYNGRLKITRAINPCQ